MQLGWWHVLWPDHLPRTHTHTHTKTRGPLPTCTSLAKQLPPLPFLVKSRVGWTKQKASWC